MFLPRLEKLDRLLKFIFLELSLILNDLTIVTFDRVADLVSISTEQELENER